MAFCEIAFQGGANVAPAGIHLRAGARKPPGQGKTVFPLSTCEEFSEQGVFSSRRDFP